MMTLKRNDERSCATGFRRLAEVRGARAWLGVLIRLLIRDVEWHGHRNLLLFFEGFEVFVQRSVEDILQHTFIVAVLTTSLLRRK